MARRIAIAGFQHETNTFSPLPTVWEDFRDPGAWPGLTRGAAILDTFAGTNIPIAGFVGAAGADELVPLLWAAAEPAGTVTRDAFDRITGEIVAGIEGAGPLDAVYLDLHGAMVTEGYDDGEAEVLARVRAVVGPDLPVAVSLDLHGNMSRAFFERASCVTIYRTYPHLDMAETGARAYRLLCDLLDRGAPFAKAWRQLDYLIPLPSQSTMHAPCDRLYGMVPGLEGAGVSSLDFVIGFPPADIPDVGASVFAYGTDRHAVDAAAEAMLRALGAAEPDFRDPLVPAREAVREAMRIAARAEAPVVIADPQDNPGAGGVGDTTGVLRALLEAGATGAALSMFWDPATARAAHDAGQGAGIAVSLGGFDPATGGPPLPVRAVVEMLSDGIFPFTGPMYGGSTADIGPSACLRLIHDRADIRVVVGSNRCQNADRALFAAFGIDPRAQRILAVKSAMHFMGDYAPIAAKVLFAKAPGANPCPIADIPYTRLRPGIRMRPGRGVFGGA